MKTSEMIQLTAAGGVLYEDESSPQKVLLIKRNGFWDLPKGKLEDGETIEECAVREVEEEIGARELSIEKFICETCHDYEMKEKLYSKTTHWYLMKFDEQDFDFVPQIKEGITEVQWVELDRAKTMVGFENLLKVLNQVG